MRKNLTTEQQIDAEQAKIAELFYRFMEFQKRNKDKKLTYIVLCTPNTPKDLKNLLEDKESDHVSLEGFHASQGYGALLSLLLAGELEKDILTAAVEMKKRMEDGIEVCGNETKH